MEKWIEKRKREMNRMTNEALLKIITRKGWQSVLAGGEIISRIEKGDQKITGDPNITRRYLKAILEDVKGSDKSKEEAIRIKEEAVRIIRKKDLLNEEFFVTILDNIASQEKREEATGAFFAQEKPISNHCLVRIIERVPKFRKRAIKMLWNQNPSSDDLLFTNEYLEGALQEEGWKMHCQIGLSIEDAIWYIEFIPSLAEMTWKKLRKEDVIKELSSEDICEISEYTDFLKVKTGVLNELWRRKENLDKERLEYLSENADLATIEDPEKLRNWVEERISKLRRLRALKELKRKLKITEGEMKKITTPSITQIRREERLKEEVERLRKKIQDLQKPL